MKQKLTEIIKYYNARTKDMACVLYAEKKLKLTCVMLRN